jgi:hypothetical protein
VLPSALFGLQVAVTTIVAALVARWYVAPVLWRASWTDAIVPLLLIHATRVVGVVFLAPAVTDPRVPAYVSVPAAVGDCATAALALTAIAWIRGGWPGQRGVVVAVNIVGIADLVYVTAAGIVVDFPSYELGAAWFIPTLLGPIMMVTHALMVALLARRLPDPVSAASSTRENRTVVK